MLNDSTQHYIQSLGHVMPAWIHWVHFSCSRQKSFFYEHTHPCCASKTYVCKTYVFNTYVYKKDVLSIYVYFVPGGLFKVENNKDRVSYTGVSSARSCMTGSFRMLRYCRCNFLILVVRAFLEVVPFRSLFKNKPHRPTHCALTHVPSTTSLH